jgi:AraC-like DNA-binding protein
VVNVSPLLKELILYACTLGTLKRRVKWQDHLIAVILHQLEAVQMVPLQLPHLSDPRLVRIAEILMKDPRNDRTLAQLCRVSGASKRSVERLFQQETGMTFGKWRQQLRLMEGMRLLAEGAKVTHAALESGYNTPSAFISMFRKALGTTPTSYFRLGAKTLSRAEK